MASRTRGWLSIMTSSTEVIPARAPTAIRNWAQWSPTWREGVGDRGVAC